MVLTLTFYNKITAQFLRHLALILINFYKYNCMKFNYLKQHWSRRMLFILSLVVAFCTVTSEGFSQSRTVTGTLIDINDGGPLIGATISEKGTTTGTISDVDGSFSIEVQDENAVLVISYVVYLTQEIPVGAQTNLDVSVTPNTTTLDEVVVVGYGTQRKRDVTAAITTISGDDIASIPVASSIDAIKGQVAGVDIQQTGGRPGQNPTIKIRGRRSIAASNDPLYVIDGIPQTSSEGDGTIFDINPEDIKSMEVLKDAAATAIYGSRGANGVILITTKRGSVGKTTVTYSSFYGRTSPTSTVDMMNGEEFAAMKRESRRRGASGAVAGRDDDDGGRPAYGRRCSARRRRRSLGDSAGGFRALLSQQEARGRGAALQLACGEGRNDRGEDARPWRRQEQAEEQRGRQCSGRCHGQDRGGRLEYPPARGREGAPRAPTRHVLALAHGSPSSPPLRAQRVNEKGAPNLEQFQGANSSRGRSHRDPR